MIGEKFNFEKKVEIINVDEIKNILNERIEVETVPNFAYIVSQINFNFNKALDSDNKDEVIEFYEKLRINDNYLSEKYRGNQEERDYMETVEKAMEIINKKIKELKKS